MSVKRMITMSRLISALIIAKPGQLRDGLQTLLMTIPQIGTVYQADSGTVVFASTATHAPGLVLLDFDLPTDDAAMTLQQIKERWPYTRCIALVDNADDHTAAGTVGAEIVLFKGVLATRLVAIIENVLLSL